MIKIEVEFESIEPGAKGVLRVDGKRSIPVRLMDIPEEALRAGAAHIKAKVEADIIAQQHSKPPKKA